MADVLKKVPVREQDPKVRATNFEEVCQGYTKEEAMAEASRCLECGCGSYFECKLIEYTNLFGAEGNARLGGEKNVNIVRNPENQGVRDALVAGQTTVRPANRASRA